MFSEVTEVPDAIDLLAARASSEEVAKGLIREMEWYDRYLDRGAVDRSANPTSGDYPFPRAFTDAAIAINVGRISPML